MGYEFIVVHYIYIYPLSLYYYIPLIIHYPYYSNIIPTIIY
jgi:hypothetical protein